MRSRDYQFDPVGAGCDQLAGANPSSGGVRWDPAAHWHDPNACLADHARTPGLDVPVESGELGSPSRRGEGRSVAPPHRPPDTRLLLSALDRSAFNDRQSGVPAMSNGWYTNGWMGLPREAAVGSGARLGSFDQLSSGSACPAPRSRRPRLRRPKRLRWQLQRSTSASSPS